MSSDQLNALLVQQLEKFEMNTVGICMAFLGCESKCVTLMYLILQMFVDKDGKHEASLPCESWYELLMCHSMQMSEDTDGKNKAFPPCEYACGLSADSSEWLERGSMDKDEAFHQYDFWYVFLCSYWTGKNRKDIDKHSW